MVAATLPIMLDRSQPLAADRHPSAEAKNSFAWRRLRHAVVTCELQPGEHCSEATLAERFGLGRAAVRMALAALAAQGLMTSRPRLGWQVAPITPGSIVELADTRRRVEPCLAAATLPAPEFRRLHGLARAAEVLQGRQGRSALSTARRADRQILDRLAQEAGGLLAQWLGSAWDLTERVAHVLTLSGNPPPIPLRTPLLDALERGDQDAALIEIEAEISTFSLFATDGLLTARPPAPRVHGLAQKGYGP
jgi:DNA-binding GntR family transcriptional regulator